MKKIINIVMLLVAFTCNVMFVKAEVNKSNLDPDNKISLPSFNYGNEFKITINGATDYELYGQSIMISESVSEELDKLKLQFDQDIKEFENEISRLQNEINDLEARYLALQREYEALVESHGEDDPETQAAKAKYQGAYNTYQTRLIEVNQKIKEYNNYIEDLKNNYYSLANDYIDDNWQKLEDNKIYVDLSNFSNKRKFVIWIKLVETGQDPVYDLEIYELTGTKVEVESITLDKTELSLKEGEEYNLTVTINPDNATTKTVTWKSDNEEIATVLNGKVVGVKEGTANITATTTDGNKVATCKVTVTKDVVIKPEDNQDEKDESKENDKSSVEDKKDYEDEKIPEKESPKTGFYSVSSFVLIGLALIVLYTTKYKKKNNFYKL